MERREEVSQQWSLKPKKRLPAWAAGQSQRTKIIWLKSDSVVDSSRLNLGEMLRRKSRTHRHQKAIELLNRESLLSKYRLPMLTFVFVLICIWSAERRL